MKQYAWEDDKTHSGFAYNVEKSWKGEQLKFMFSFIANNFELDSTIPLKVLDIGCNAALNMKRFSITYSNDKNEYYGYDINEAALELGRKNIPNGKFFKTNFHLENCLSNYEDNFFDFCFVTWVFTHIPTEGDGREKIVREVLRTSKKGIILDPCMRGKNIDINEFPYVLSREKDDPTNVVVIDDYRRYEPFVKQHDTIYQGNTSLFYWDKI